MNAHHIVEIEPGSGRYKLVISPREEKNAWLSQETKEKIIFFLCMYGFIALLMWIYTANPV